MGPDAALQEVIRLVVAAALGAAIGWEREWGDRAAGLRTHALVAMGAALIMLVSSYGFVDVVTADRTVALDPSRIAAQVVSGIGFLGAGTIIVRRSAVRGLTTAASIWVVAGIGLACGAGLFAAAIATTVLGLGILGGLKPVERRIFPHKRVTVLCMTVQRRAGQMVALEDAVRGSGVELWSLRVEPGPNDSEVAVRLELRGEPPGGLPALLEQLRSVPGVVSLEYGRRQMSLDDNDLHGEPV